MKILVFTNYDSMKNVYSPAVSITDDSGIVTPNSFGVLLQNNKIVCREGTKWNGYTVLPNIMDSSFVLIKDDISFEDFGLLKGKIVDSEYYIIHHRKPDAEKFKEFKGSINWKEGQHEPKNPLYQPIANCIAGAGNKPDKQLVEEIDIKLNLSSVKLERQKTDFLYSIYKGNKPEEIIIPDIVKQTAGAEELIRYFNDNRYEKNEKGANLCSEQNLKFVQLMGTLGFKHK